jgi:hypothetical protein
VDMCIVGVVLDMSWVSALRTLVAGSGKGVEISRVS